MSLRSPRRQSPSAVAEQLLVGSHDGTGYGAVRRLPARRASPGLKERLVDGDREHGHPQRLTARGRACQALGVLLDVARGRHHRRMAVAVVLGR